MQPLKMYRSYYPHQSRDFLSPVCRIFLYTNIHPGECFSYVHHVLVKIFYHLFKKHVIFNIGIGIDFYGTAK